MSGTEAKSDEHIFIHVVTMFTQQAWLAMGKLKNPMTDKMERNLQEAIFFIDILDMMKKRMAGNLSDDEEKFLESSLSGLKMNYLEESNKSEPDTSEEEPTDSEQDVDQDKTPKEEQAEDEKDKNTDEASAEQKNEEEKSEAPDSGEKNDRDEKPEWHLKSWTEL